MEQRGFAGGADGQRSDDHGWNGFTDDADAQSKVMGIPRIVERYDIPGQFITTSAEVTSKGSLVRESYPKWPKKFRLRIYNKIAQM